MSSTDKVFAGAVPDVYDEYLVPLIFEDHAEDLARRVSALNPKDILETAAGSGVVTRALARALGSDVRLTITDLNQPMLDRAARIQGEDARITWTQADALDLPFGDASFDAVLCQFGAMFFPDRIKGYSEALRVLRPGGRFLFNIWDRIEENEFADEVTKALGELFPDDPPVFMARTPHGHANTDTICAELQTAGYTDIRIDTVAGVSRAPDPYHPAIAYCQGTPLRGEIEARDPDGLESCTEFAAQAIGRRWGDGPIEAKIQGHVIEATRP